MGTDKINREDIFNIAAEMEKPAERASYLDRVCGGDTELRADIESLLRSDQKAGGFLESQVIDSGVRWDDSAVAEGPGTVIGRYKLLEKIGEGGMAVVYMAEQAEPIRRKVALKIIKLGMDTKQVIARFEAERQALALMDHPNIAKVLDAGATETGRPYFVMELVQGVSITEYCDRNSLGTKERLALFIQVCDAVQHAHQRGIIHRDLKPSNVMVAHHDGKPVPKIIDFGIAKATNQRLTEKTLFTRYAHIIGTPAYMSPEQAELSELEIDTRSDIYSLGVLLYELLTGTTPFSEEELRQAGYLEMQRIIREKEPARPSTKLSTLGETLTDIAKRRGCTPDLLTKTVRGDLDWIVMKALEKDRTRRYEGAFGLATDIQRHLEHRPVAAHAPSAAYRLDKFLRRNRLQVAAALALLAVAATIILSSLWSRHQVQLAEAEGVRQVNVVAEARKLIAKRDLPAARKALRPILESKHVGLEARTLFANTLIVGDEPDETTRDAAAIMERHYRERVQFYTEQIAGNPKDPNNYLRRARQYHYLGQEQDIQGDMIRYASALGQGQLPMLLFGPAKRFQPLAHVASRYQFVLSVARREDGIVVMSVALGQKGRSSMKPFEIPMILASLFGLCLFPSLDTPVVLADFTFGEPVNLRTIIPVLDPLHDVVKCFSHDGLEMYVDSDRTGGYGAWDIWVLKRASTSEGWGPPENLGPAVNSSKNDLHPSISADGLTLYFSSQRPGGNGSADIYMTTRSTRDDAWGQVLNMGPRINCVNADLCPCISPDGLELYFTSYVRGSGYGGYDFYVVRRVTPSDPWGEPANLGPVVNSAYHEIQASLSPDGLLMFFSDSENFRNMPRPGGYGGPDMWMTRRASLSDPWQPPMNLGPNVNGPGGEYVPRISPDGRMLYFTTDLPYENWQAPVLRVVDFNGDGKVDGKEVLDIVEHFGQDDSLYDIGPSALGDGVVDADDLIALADYIGTESVDPTLRAHWAFDEAQGAVAADSAGDYDGMLTGGATWQPQGGMVGGALKCDGVTGCVVTDTIPDLGDGSFSVIAWVKGGAPGQIILSHNGTTDWLVANPIDGSLMTNLTSPTQLLAIGTSEAVVTDGKWHRIALVWDGTDRILYADGKEVARDAQPDITVTDGVFMIGASNKPGTLWSGLIDDVRIYSRIVRP